MLRPSEQACTWNHGFHCAVQTASALCFPEKKRIVKMGIRQRFEHGKALLNQGADLLLLRLQVLSLDLTRQAENVFRLAIWLVLSGALLMVGLVGLLFGLNRVLSDVAALWVFFGIFFVSLLIIAVLFRKVSADYREQGSRVAETLQDIRSDIAYLRGEIDKDADDEATGV
jgi:hypothetical protein